MRLELLDFISRMFDVDMSKCLLIGCQHLLLPQLVMFEEFFNKGLRPENTFILGKCYSTSKIIAERLAKKGVFVHPGSLRFDSHRSFDEQFDSDVIDLINTVKKKKDLKKFESIILMDDGGYLIHHANKLLSGNITAVEQTSSGYNKLKNEKIYFPIINVARSKAKLVVESPIISEAIVRYMRQSLKRMHLKPRKVLIVGMGAVGKAIYNDLKNIYDVKTYDIIHEKKDLYTLMKNCDMIIGCTGKCIIDNHIDLPKNIILVSASSSDREFNAVGLRILTAKNAIIHKNYHVENRYLLNSGFPVCFAGDVTSSPPKKIQLTMALLSAGVYLGLTKKYSKGIIDLDKAVQDKIIKNFFRINL